MVGPTVTSHQPTLGGDRATVCGLIRWPRSAAGDKGQSIYVSPYKNLVIVRNGMQYGMSMMEWLRLFCRFATEF